MIIDTDALRAAIQADLELRADGIEKLFPTPAADEPVIESIERAALRRYTRLEEEQAELCELLDRVEQLARETPGGETTERE